MPAICTKTISQLTGMNFSIPSYQRGFRWQEIQVKQLLDDLWEFYQARDTNPDAWYCLQPLVVAQETLGEWTVIDGQQRLTALFIILKQLDETNIWEIRYETRQGSEKFLNDVTPEDETSGTNPDYFFIQKAADTVSIWLEDKKKTEPEFGSPIFAEYIRQKASFIKYETKENHYDVFTRLNSGKISLSNAELIKALLLRESRFNEKGGTIKLQQHEIAGEWDRIEQFLGDDEFWYFINPDAQSTRFNATRIDYLFELVLRKGFGAQSSILNYLDKIKHNPYLGFATFAEYCKRTESEAAPEETIWSEIQSVFRRIKAWYDNRSLYHFIGFLMNRKGEQEEKRIQTLVGLLRKSEEDMRTKFLEAIKGTCGETIKEGKKLDQLKYDLDNPKLNDVLLLFNLALLDRQNTEKSRYPFKTHTGTAWSLEHIHAKQERKLTEEDIKDLKSKHCSDDLHATHSDLKNALKQKFQGAIKLEHSKTPDGEDVPNEWVLKCEGQDTHGLENLALLERKQNAKFNNGLYPEKRFTLSIWEQGTHTEELPDFIPLGTKMAFFKHFSSRESASFVWDTFDSRAYLNTIIKTVAEYVGVSKDCLLNSTNATNQ